MKLLHYGLQRSGTNFIETVLNKNYQVHFLNSNASRSSPLQKHCRFYPQKELIPEPQYANEIFVETFQQFQSLFPTPPDYYLIISKDPYSWYLSYKNWADKCRWPAVAHHYIEEYNLFYGTFMELARQSERFLFIRYVDFLTNTDSALDQLESQLGLRRRWLSRFRRFKPSVVSQSDPFSERRRAYYLNEEYLADYSADELRRLNDLVDPKLVSFLGYESRNSAK